MGYGRLYKIKNLFKNNIFFDVNNIRSSANIDDSFLNKSFKGKYFLKPKKSIKIEKSRLKESQINNLINKKLAVKTISVVNPVINHLTWWVDWKTLYYLDNGGPIATSRATNIITRMIAANVNITMPRSTYGNLIDAATIAWIDPLLQSYNPKIQLLHSNFINYISNSGTWHLNMQPGVEPVLPSSNIMKTCLSYDDILWTNRVAEPISFANDLINRGYSVPASIWVIDEMFYDPRRFQFLFPSNQLLTNCTRCNTLENAMVGFKKKVTDQLDSYESNINPNIIASFFRGFDFNPNYTSLGDDYKANYWPIVEGRNYPEPGIYNTCAAEDPVAVLEENIELGASVRGGRPTLGLPDFTIEKSYNLCYALAKNGAVGVTFYWDNFMLGESTESYDDNLLSMMEAANQAFVDYEYNATHSVY